MNHRNWLLLGLALMAFAIGFAIFVIANSVDEIPKPVGGRGIAKAEDELGLPDFILVADSMVKELIADADAAGAKYQGKIIELTGEVYGVMDKNFVLLNGKKTKKGDIAFAVACGTPRRNVAQVNIVSQLSKGQKIKVVGKCTVIEQGKWLQMGFCTITELEPSKINRVSAEKICVDYEADRVSASDKYGKDDSVWASDVIVRGEIIALTKDEDFCHAKLAGTAKTRVSLTIHEDDFKGLQIGQTAEYRGVHVVYYPERNEVSLDGAMLLHPVVRWPNPLRP